MSQTGIKKKVCCSVLYFSWWRSEYHRLMQRDTMCWYLFYSGWRRRRLQTCPTCSVCHLLLVRSSALLCWTDFYIRYCVLFIIVLFLCLPPPPLMWEPPALGASSTAHHMCHPLPILDHAHLCLCALLDHTCQTEHTNKMGSLTPCPITFAFQHRSLSDCVCKQARKYPIVLYW